MKIVFTIYNLAFISNWIEKIQPYMKNCEITIFHIAMLQHKTPKIIKGIKYYDVSNLSFSEIDTIITNIHPDLLINFHFRSLFELLIQRSFINHGIKQVYLQHGFFSQNSLHFKTQKAKQNYKATILRQINFCKKYIGFLLHKKSSLLQEINILRKIYLKKELSVSPYDHYYIFSQREYNFLSKVYKINEHNTTVIGYPIFSEESDKTQLLSQNKMTSEVLYVHQPFIQDGYAQINYDTELKYINNIWLVLKKKYNKFTILLHPRENLAAYRQRFINTEIKIVQAPNDYSIFADKALILGHYSTALLYGIYLEKPTAILQYPTVVNDPIFKDYCPSINNIEELVTKDISINIKMKNYFVGPNNTYEHIAKELMNFVRDKSI